MFTRTEERSKNTKKTGHSKALKLLQRHKKERGKQERKNAPSRATQDSLAYRAMYEDGLCEVAPGVFSKSVAISDINYQISDRDHQSDIFSKYAEFLNGFDSESTVQINIINRRKDIRQFMQETSFKHRPDDLNALRDEMNHIMRERVESGNTSLLKEKYVTFTQHADDRQRAKTSLNQLQANVVTSFHQMGSTARPLNGLRRLQLANATLRPGSVLHFDYDDLKYSGLTTHSVIAPTSFNFKHAKNRFTMGDQVAQVLYLRDYPPEISDRLITDLTDIMADLEIAIQIHPIDPVKGMKMVQTKKGFMQKQKADEQQKAMKAGYDPDILPENLTHSLDEAEDLLQQMQDDNQQLFDVTFLVMAQGKTDQQLDEIIEQVKAAGRRHSCEFANLDYLQEQALNSVLMWGQNYVPVSRTLTTSAAAIFIPFTAQELSDSSGLVYGVNQVTQNLVTADRRNLKAGNGMILGRPGAGKSFASKQEMLSVRLRDADSEVLIIDPEREYSAVTQALGGEVIPISQGAAAHINPMEINEDYGDDEDPVIFKTDFILSMCDMLLGGKNGLSAERRTLIDRACRLTDQRYFEQHTAMPTMVDLSNTLKQQPEEEGKQIALELEPYIEGSLSVFAHQTNVDNDNSVVVYDVKDLGKNLRSMGMLIVLDQIWNRITKNRNSGKRTWIYVDEMQLLLSNEFASNYFFELWSRARKWGALPTGITQNVETLLLSDNARRMLSNSEFVLLLDQAANDRDQLTEMLHLSEQEEGYITNADSGHGLMIAGDAVIPFENDFPKKTKLYKIMSTKPEDMEQYISRKKLHEDGGEVSGE